MNKFLLVLFLLFCPFISVNAFQNEPNGFAGMYWGESLTNVQKSHQTEFLRYNGDAMQYRIFIDDTHGELGFYDKNVYWIGTFENGALKGIFLELLVYHQTDDVFDRLKKQISGICGIPKYSTDTAAIWSGRTTFMMIYKDKPYVRVALSKSNMP